MRPKVHLRWQRVAIGDRQYEYHAMLGEKVLAVVVKTGSHLDDYPWDWYLTTATDPIQGTKSSGVEPTLKAAKASVAYAYGME
jgi:hypothetical protein